MTHNTHEISIIQLGIGGVGRALAQEVMNQQAALHQRYGFKLGYRALIARDGIVHTGELLSYDMVQETLAAKREGHSLATIPGGNPPTTDWLSLLPDTPAIIVDVTAADGMEQQFTTALQAGHRLIFANKRPFTTSLDFFQTLTGHGKTRYEATVGAGVPVIDTLQRLLDSGDTILRIEAAMSGTLGYLCSALEQGTLLSNAVWVAKENGWTEPDPRDDLSGADVARKALILGRTCGFSWEMKDVPSEPWYPDTLSDVDIPTFVERTKELDERFAQRVQKAKENQTVLRYIATIEPDQVQVGLRTLPITHPLAGLQGTDNMVVFHTARYSDPLPPLVVRGAGAGTDVTAAGVLGDIVATAREMCAQ